MNIPSISKSEFRRHLKSSPHDDLKLLKNITDSLNIFGSKFVIPPPKSKVCLLLSGGLDSIVAWAVLMEEYHLEVYPLNVIRGQSRNKNQEQKSIKFYSKIFRQRYPALFHPPFTLDCSLSTLHINYQKFNQELHPQAILKALYSPTSATLNTSLNSFSLLPTVSRMYCQYLSLKSNIVINDIFCGVIPTDGHYSPEQSYTSLKSYTLGLRLSTHNPKWNFTSIFYEEATLFYWYKKDLVVWAQKHNLTLINTWSCFDNKRVHCGSCPTCLQRKNAFIQSQITDPTIYLDNNDSV